MICDLLNSGLILLEEESNGKSLVQILESIITKYNKQKGVDSGLDARRLASDKGLVYLNGFLLIEVCRSYRFDSRAFEKARCLTMFCLRDSRSDLLFQNRITSNSSFYF